MKKVIVFVILAALLAVPAAAQEDEELRGTCGDEIAWILEGDTLTVYAPDDITLGRLDNDRVRGLLSEEGAAAAGMPVRLLLRTGEPPRATPQENLKNLLKFSSQFDNIEIK